MQDKTIRSALLCCCKLTSTHAALAQYRQMENSGGKQPLNNDGSVITLEAGKVLKQSFSSFTYTDYDLVVKNINEEQKSIKFVIMPYVCDGNTVKYYSKTIRDAVFGISYNDILSMPEDDNEFF